MNGTPAPALHAAAPTIDDVARALADADRAQARAVAMLGAALVAGTIAAGTGLGAEAALRALGRRTGWEARGLVRLAGICARMPRLAEALRRGMLSPSQAQGIARAVHGLGRRDLERVDALVGTRAAALADAEADQVLEEVEGLVAHIALAREETQQDRAIERRFLWMQPGLGGGGAIYAQADPESFASIATAIEAAAGRPDPVLARGAQRMDALVGICEASLAGTGTSSHAARPRPRVLVVAQAPSPGHQVTAARALIPVPGRPVRVGATWAQAMLCDAEVVAVTLDAAGVPTSVGAAHKTVSDRVRTAVVARDAGCRFPGCDAPAAWCDCHHIAPRSMGGGNDVTNLVLLCRRCHRRVHRRRWRITPGPDGSIAFAHRGRIVRSYPRARGSPPPTAPG